MLPDCTPEPLGLYLLYPHRNLLPAKVKLFSDFLIERTKALLDRPEELSRAA